MKPPWLKSKGFTVDEVTAGRWMVEFSGTVAQAEQAFQTELHYYRVGQRTYFANLSAPKIPAALAGLVHSIAGLDNFSTLPRKKAQPQAMANSGQYFIDPVDFATIYGLGGLYANGIRGAGQAIAVIEACTMDVSLSGTFWNLEGLPSQGLWYWNYGAPVDCSQKPDDIDEVYLDYQWAGALAPDAKIWLVSSGSSDVLLGAVAGVVNNQFAPVVTMSYSSCTSQSYAETWIQLWQQAHVSGITGLVSSGDEGAAGCDLGDDTATTATQISSMPRLFALVNAAASRTLWWLSTIFSI